jgi:hypothetical protein
MVHITITDFSGKTTATFLQSIAENRLVEFNLGSYSTGIYLVRLQGKTVNETIKVIKQ